MSSDDYASLSCEELRKILILADHEQDAGTVQIILRILANRHQPVKQALVDWAQQDPATSKSIAVVVNEALKGPVNCH
ncbi:hypothetical protein OG802_04315 [Streptomyces sp. NBC_00704]|uniref:hypothetical protein n=1 Tax=unclassified Streptomyces TaxID=2593676 RepID=UPI002E331C97|nr:hypothetical protein [Streptomyces sp. NBC_00704]